MSAFCEYCVLSGRGLCVRLITRLEESYRVRMCRCDREASIMRRSCATHKKKYHVFTVNIYGRVVGFLYFFVQHFACVAVLFTDRNFCDFMKVDIKF